MAYFLNHALLISRRPIRGKGGRQTHSCKAASYMPVRREVPSSTGHGVRLVGRLSPGVAPRSSA